MFTNPCPLLIKRTDVLPQDLVTFRSHEIRAMHDKTISSLSNQNLKMYILHNMSESDERKWSVFCCCSRSADRGFHKFIMPASCIICLGGATESNFGNSLSSGKKGFLSGEVMKFYRPLRSGVRFNIKMASFQYWESDNGDKTVLFPQLLYWASIHEYH